MRLNAYGLKHLKHRSFLIVFFPLFFLLFPLRTTTEPPSSNTDSASAISQNKRIGCAPRIPSPSFEIGKKRKKGKKSKKVYHIRQKNWRWNQFPITSFTNQWNKSTMMLANFNFQSWKVRNFLLKNFTWM